MNALKAGKATLTKCFSIIFPKEFLSFSYVLKEKKERKKNVIIIQKGLRKRKKGYKQLIE